MNLYKKFKSGVYMIAEMSANHDKDINVALEIVHKAKDSGADCVKVQTYTADTMTINCDTSDFIIDEGLWKGYSLYDLYTEASMPWEWQLRIKKECEKLNMDFLSTPFDKNSVDFLESINVEMYKISSFELIDIPLIRYVASKGKPMIVSCGMGTIDEIQDAVDAILKEKLPKDKIVLLKCTSSYPAKTRDMNLNTITDLKERFGTHVGLSDHSIGETAPVVATSLGAKVIEKHFCLSRKQGGPDSAFSSEPMEFKKMSDDVNNAYMSLGTAEYGFNEAESYNHRLRRSIYAINNINEGEIFTNKNIRVIRPGLGLPPKYYDVIMGNHSKKSYSRGDRISIEELDGFI